MAASPAGGEGRYWLLSGSVPTGPYTVEQIHAKLVAGEVAWETIACPFGSSDWLPLARTPGVGPTPSPQDIPSAPPVLAAASTDLSDRGSAGKTPMESGPGQPSPAGSPQGKAGEGNPNDGVGWPGGGAKPQAMRSFHLSWSDPNGSGLAGEVLGVIAVVVIGCIVVGVGLSTSSSKTTAVTTRPAAVASRPAARPASVAPPGPAAHWDLPPVIGRINVSAADGTASLQALVARLPPDEVVALGLGVLLTGVDVYGIKVRISNTGTGPVRVFPGNLRVHFGQETVSVTTANHPQFLQPCVVQPGNSVEGLVMYEAAVDVGAVIRLLGTSFSYDDPSISVTYGP